jgi:hypothetical protein
MRLTEVVVVANLEAKQPLRKPFPSDGFHAKSMHIFYIVKSLVVESSERSENS